MTRRVRPWLGGALIKRLEDYTERFALTLGTTLLFIGMMPAAVHAQNTIGHVLDISGDWYLYVGGADSNEGQKLSRWQDVPAAGIIRIKTPSKDDHISIIDIHLNVLVERKCASSESCYQPIFLPANLTESGILEETSALLNGAWNLLWGEPYQSSLFRTRGAAPLLDEGVAPIVNGEADLRGLMQGMSSGKYSLVEYRGQSPEDRVVESTVFDWNPATPAAISIGNRKPGVYEISSVVSVNQDNLSRLSLRVLLSTSKDYLVAADSFKKVRSLTDKWAGATDPTTVHDFLRAYLSQLAKANGG